MTKKHKEISGGDNIQFKIRLEILAYSKSNTYLCTQKNYYGYKNKKKNDDKGGT